MMRDFSKSRGAIAMMATAVDRFETILKAVWIYCRMIIRHAIFVGRTDC